MRFPFRSIAAICLAVGAITCTDTASRAPSAPAPGARRLARIGFEPVFSKTALTAAAHLADFDLNFDHVRVVLVRPIADTVVDTLITFVPGQPDVTLDFTVPVHADNESFQAAIDYTNPGGVVFHGEGTVQSHAPDQPAPTQQITVNYAGPGATVTHITISPKTTTIVAPSVLNFTVTALDANNAPVTGVPINYSVSDATVATISNTGTLTTTGKRGVVTVTAVTPTQATDKANVTVNLPPAQLVLVSGGGQTGKVGTPLSLPAVVRLTAVDGVGIPGVTVNFAAPSGGKVGAASVATDANGSASTSLTLGGAVGPQSFAAVAQGFSVAIPATATVGAVANITPVSGAGQQDSVKKTLKSPLVAKVTDSFNNPISGATVTWSTSGTGQLSAASSTTATDGTTSVGYTLGTAVGSETITATTSGVQTPATFTVQAIAGSASGLSIVSGDGQSARIQEVLSPFVVKVTDLGGNPVSGATVTWASTNGKLASATTTTDANGTSSNTMTLGLVAGPASATASAGGKTVTFGATVLVGIVAKIDYKVQPPATATAAAALAPAIQVVLQDAGGNPSNATNAVSIALGVNPGNGTLSGTLTKNAVAGVATFDDLRIDKAGVGYTLVASTAGAPNATSTSFTIGAGSAANLSIVAGEGQTATVNASVATPPSVKLVDANQNPIANVAITFTPSGNGIIAPTSPVSTNAQGIATLTSWTLGSVSGPQTLLASMQSGPNVTFHATANPDVPAKLSIVAQPASSAQSGIAFNPQPVIQVQDVNGNSVPQSGIAITASVATGSGTLGGTLIVNTDAQGKATFTDLRLNGPVGTRTLQFTSGTLTPITSGTVTLAAGNPAALTITTQPVNTTSNALISPIGVNIVDGDGNVVLTQNSAASIAFGANPGGGTLTGTTARSFSSGSVSFNDLRIDKAGTGYTLTITSGNLSTTSVPFTISAGQATSLVIVAGEGQTGTVGVPVATPPSVRLLDAASNPIAGANVSFAPAQGSGSVAPTQPIVTNAQGLATLTSWTLGTTTGAMSMTVSSAGVPNVTFHATAQAGAPTHLAVSVSAAQQIAGGTVNVSAQLLDAFENTVPLAGRTINWTSTGGGSFAQTSNTTNASGTTPTQLFTTSTTSDVVHTITATDALSPTVTGQATVTTTAGAAAKIALITQPSATVQSGIVFPTQPVFQLQDANGNPVRLAGATINVSIATGGGTLGGTTSFTIPSGPPNQTTFAFANLKIDGTASPPSRTLLFSGQGLTSVTSNPITLIPGTPAVLSIGTQPTSATSNTVISPAITVSVLDADGNLVTTANNLITAGISTNPGGGALTGTAARTASAGVATFNDLKIDKAGTGYTLVFSGSGLTSATSSSFNISAGAPATMTILAGDNQTGTAGQQAPTAPSLVIRDLAGNPVPNVSVTFTPAQGSGSVTPTTPVATNSSGIASLTSWTLGTVTGAQTVTATAGALTQTFHAQANAGAAAQLVILRQPDLNPQSGVPFSSQPIIQVEDGNGNPVAQSGFQVAAAIATGGGTLGGTTIVATDASGKATFVSLKINGSTASGTRTLQFTSGGLTPATSVAMTLTAGVAAKLAFTVQPSNVVTNTVMSPAPRVAILDADGNAVTSSQANVSIAITAGTGTSGATLSGTSPVTASSGVATFNNLSIDLAGSAYSVTATVGGLTSAISSAFNVTNPPPTISSLGVSDIDQVFSNVQIFMNGSGYVQGGTTVNIANGKGTASGVSLDGPTFLLANLAINGTLTTSQTTLSVTTVNGTSNSVPINFWSVAGAPTQFGTANGGSGGSVYNLDCTTGDIATGIVAHAGGTPGASTASVDWIQVICSSVTGTSRTIGTPFLTAQAGGSQAAPGTVMPCGTNNILVGLQGRVGNGGFGFVDQVGPICMPTSGGATTTPSSVGFNNSGSTSFFSQCPSALAVSGLTGGAGSSLDRTQIKCK